jgi:RIO-like serine/threonine protein kinase
MFSVSLLTTVAMMDGIIQSLAVRYHYESTTALCQPSGTLNPIANGSKTTWPDISEERARREAMHVLREMQSLVGVPEVRRWSHHQKLLTLCL